MSDAANAESMLTAAFVEFLKTQGAGADVRVDARDDEGDDNIQFVKNGWVRIKAGGEEHRLRNLKFGQLKVLFTLLEEQQDLVTRHRETCLRQENALKKRLTETIDPMEECEEKWQAQADIAIQLRSIVRSIRDKADELRMEWWTRAFEIANVQRSGETERSKGIVPREWPAWVADGSLPTKLLEHWRSVPLGRG